MANEKWERINKSREERPKVQSWDNYWELPIATVSFPIKGSAGKTGDWRTFKPVIDQEKCIKCYFCFMYCPEGTMKINDETKTVFTDYDYCKGCGMCAANCPVKCIEMEKEKK